MKGRVARVIHAAPIVKAQQITRRVEHVRARRQRKDTAHFHPAERADLARIQSHDAICGDTQLPQV